MHPMDVPKAGRLTILAHPRGAAGAGDQAGVAQSRDERVPQDRGSERDILTSSKEGP